MTESFNDPLMKKVSKLEELATASEAQEQFEEFAKDYDKQPADPTRENLIKNIDQLSGSSENTVNMVMAMMKGAQIGQNAELPSSEKVSSNEIDEAMREIRPQIEMIVSVKTRLLPWDLPMRTSRAAAKQKTSKENFQELINKGITRASPTGENLGKDMARLLDEEKKIRPN